MSLVTGYADSMNDSSDTKQPHDRRAAWRQRQAERGLKQCVVWVPQNDCERVRRYASALLAAYEQERRKEAKAAAKQG